MISRLHWYITKETCISGIYFSNAKMVNIKKYIKMYHTIRVTFHMIISKDAEKA